MSSSISISIARFVAPALLAGIVLHAAILRLDALFDSYGPYMEPGWLAALQPAVTAAAPAVSPDGWRWRHVNNPYAGGDPQNYLRFAREMRHFYQAHVREPMFLGATRIWLLLAGNADVAVSLASITFSLLMLPATYAVGRQIASPAVGLAAAAALGIDRSAVAWSIEGWRDEMFAFFVVLNAWAWLRAVRARTYRSAVLAGIAGAGACLTRITAMTLILPAWLWLLATRDGAAPRRRLQLAGLSAVVMAVTVAPYLINCAIELGDPLYAINDHTRFYLGREGAADTSKQSALRYTLEKFSLRPLATIDTAVQGVIVYPFSIKWVGLDRWHDGLGVALSWLAIGGLVAWGWQPFGRFLLLILAGSLVPYMLTWAIRGGAEWRFTLHAYPFYLLAAFWFLATVAQATRMTIRAGVAPTLRQLDRRSVVQTLAALTVLAVAAALWTFGMPYAVAREALLGGEPAVIRAGTRDRWLFSGGWSELTVSGNVVSRFATDQTATLVVPLPEARPYKFVLRLDPLGDSATLRQKVRVLINQQTVEVLQLQWDPERVGQYEVSPPAGVLRRGMNEITLQSENMVSIGHTGDAFPEIPRDRDVGVRLWYVLIVPA